jgi:signal transduction histidine kinase
MVLDVWKEHCYALTNVIENALHAMPGSGRLTISVRQGATPSHQSAAASHQPLATGHQSPATSHQPPSIVVQVTDTGVGMDQDALGRIFEPYFSTKATGTGLGLTIAKRNVELNGGTIAVTSQRGAGTTVTIELP